MARLDTEVEERNGRAHVSLRGELDIASASVLGYAVRDALSRVGDVVVLDLSGIDFIDSTGLYSIVRGGEQIKASGKRLLLVRGPPAIHRAFEMTRLDERFEFVDE
jgi:anti-anti-sigma factor